jgi:hypothetical protein
VSRGGDDAERSDEEERRAVSKADFHDFADPPVGPGLEPNREPNEVRATSATM